MVRLEMATGGPCAGHLCDNCRICLKGHCCRRDNPDYRLPKIGEWDGPIHGEIGVLVHEAGKVQCHACGEWFGLLAPHIFWNHDLTNQEYRAIFGLHPRRPLCGELFSEATRQRNAQHPDQVMRFAQAGKQALQQITPEQRRDRAERTLERGKFDRGPKTFNDGMRRYRERRVKEGSDPRYLGRFRHMSDDEVREVRELHSRHGWSCARIARKFGRHEKSIRNICTYQSHRDVS